MEKKALERGVSVGAPLGNLGGARGGVRLLGILIVELRLRKCSISPCGSSVRGTCRVGSFAGDPEGYVEEGLGDLHFSPWRPRWEA